MARNRLLYRGGSSVLRGPILKWRSNLRVLRGGVEDFRSVSRPMARRSFGLSARERRSEMGVDMFKSKALEKDQNAATNVAEVVGRTVQRQDSVLEHAPPSRESTTDSAPS